MTDDTRRIIYDITFRMRATLDVEGHHGRCNEPGDLIDTIDGQITDGEGRDAEVVGSLRAQRLRIDRTLDEEVDPGEVCDAHSDEMLGLYQTLFTRQGNLRRPR